MRIHWCIRYISATVAAATTTTKSKNRIKQNRNSSGIFFLFVCFGFIRQKEITIKKKSSQLLHKCTSYIQIEISDLSITSANKTKKTHTQINSLIQAVCKWWFHIDIITIIYCIYIYIHGRIYVNGVSGGYANGLHHPYLLLLKQKYIPKSENKTNKKSFTYWKIKSMNIEHKRKQTNKKRQIASIE